MVLLRHMKGPLEEPRLGRSRRPVRRNVTVAATGQASVSGNALVAKHPEAFSYDADGNLTQDGRWHYTWDGENRLVRMSSANTNPAVGPQQWVEFEYDWQGRRVSKKVGAAGSGVATNDLRFVYDGWNLVAILNSDFSLLTSFAWGLDLSGTMEGAGGVGGLLWMTVPSGPNAGTYFYAHDGNGNVMALVSAADGSVAARYEYGPFGELIRATGPMAKVNPFRFSTKYQDEEPGLVYYGYRYYDPGTGRWPNRDPLGEPGFELLRGRGGKLRGDGPNLYAFVRNNPVGRIDFLGLLGNPNPKPDPCPCGEAAAQIAAAGPIDANTARRLANEALAAARASGLPGLHNGPADAFRHCFWSCRMAQEIGAGQAKEVGDTHERCNKNPAGEESMDQANNATGRGFGTPGANCHDLCLQAARDGTLQTSPGGTPPANPY